MAVLGQWLYTGPAVCIASFYFMRRLVNKLASRGRSVAGFVAGTLGDLERFLQQFVCMFI